MFSDLWFKNEQRVKDFYSELIDIDYEFHGININNGNKKF
jgi:hypothetical protein